MLPIMKKKSGDIVECYVVRIYRRDSKNASLAEGVVEGPGGDSLKVFHSASELLDGLAFPSQGDKTAFGRGRTAARRGV